ncbi:RHS repeat-associated core domain-containing protein [Streptomyces sp. NPDC007088]|uniref:RHS repeat-associated core domain-containing protein n=1 Tax=Streptomyces sp. NPDC007088 TaxID=3364773 RepID=UPI0036CB22FA
MSTAKTGNGTYTYADEDANELTHQTTDKGEDVDYVYGAPDQYGMPVVEQVELKEGTAYIDHDPTTGQPLSLRTTNGYEAYYIVDGIGNPVQFINQSTDQSGDLRLHDPYGAVQIDKPTGTAAVQNPYRFVGGTYDRTTGYVKFGRRWYDPTTGRFTTQDQYSFLGDPARGNRYAYAGGDPINNTDPNGQWSITDAMSVGLAVVGVAAATPTGGASLSALGAAGLIGAEAGFGLSLGCGLSDEC